MRKWQMVILFIPFVSLALSKGFAQEHPSFGVVNLSTCITESKYGKQEQEVMEKIKVQMSALINDVEKRLQDLNSKLNDPEFCDSLSPEAEKDLHNRYQTSKEERDSYHNQYMQLIQRANMNLMEVMDNHIAKASKILAERKQLSVIARGEVYFFYNPNYDITADIIEEMDKDFDKQKKIEPGKTTQ